MAHTKSHCQLALQSPRTITEKIEAYVARGAMDEERRAQKALLLLKARDQQISLLERRVAQLESAAADMHAITLQVKIPTPESSDKTSYFSAAPLDSLTSSEPRETECEHPPLVPELKLSTYSQPTDSENDVFSTPVSPSSSDHGLQMPDKTSENVDGAVISDESMYFLRSSKQTSVDTLPRGRSGEHARQVDSTGVKDPDKDFTKTCNVNVDNKILSEITGQIPDNDCSLTLLMAAAALLQSKEIDAVKSPMDREVGFGKLESSRSVRLSTSVPWVRVKRRLRRKSRGHDPLGLGTQSKDVRRQRLGFESVTRSLPAVNSTFPESVVDGDQDQLRGPEMEVLEESDVALGVKTAQGATTTLRLTPRSDHKNTPSKKDVIIQTTPVEINEPAAFEVPVERKNINDHQNLEIPTGKLEDKKTSKYWSADDEPAPQWLIEEALSRGRELSMMNRFDKASGSSTEIDKDVSSLKLKYDEIISDLEGKLNDMKIELDEAYRKNSNLKDKFKRALRNTKMEALRENEILQEKIVRICSSVLEKFGPYAFDGKRASKNVAKSRKTSKRYGILSRKLNRKLRSTLVASNKLRDELAKTKEGLGEKTKQYESLDRRFTRLKQELETTELNLNDLINENSSLRKKFEDTREWMEMKIGKDRNEKNNFIQFKDIQKSRDILNLKKKTEEDFATITQLRNKLLRSESANANKGFLLNSYKGQLADMVKEKDQGASRIKELENDLTQLRNTNAQLKAKISLLLNEKEKLVSESEKSEHDLKEKMETKLTLKYEKSMLREIESMKVKCDDLVEVMRIRMKTAESCSSEYSAAISGFLERLESHLGDSELESTFGDGEASHREAHETACSILNMTPKELSGFMKGRSTNKINAWLIEFQRITSKSGFSDALANFLFKKACNAV